jgi:indolepyruvate ferredoxin oxidoreductase beta subunit
MVPPGEADFLVVLAPSEVPVTAGCLRPAGVLLGPDLLDVARLPNRRSFNVAMMGALSVHLDLPAEAWQAALADTLPAATLELNRRAFEAGRAAGLITRSAG